MEASSQVQARFHYLLLITVLSVAPAILVLMTSFTRIVIVLGFVRTSLGYTANAAESSIDWTRDVSDFLYYGTYIGQRLMIVALQPYLKGDITQTEALEKQRFR